MSCSIPGCARDVRALGWCSRHYHRNRRWGDPLGGPHPEGYGDPLCPHCRERPRDESGFCPECKRAYGRFYRATHREQINAVKARRKRERRVSDPEWREREAAKRRVKKAALGEAHRAAQRRYYADNAERIRAQAREKIKLKQYRAKRADAEGRRKALKLSRLVEQVDRMRVLREASGLCGLCGEPVDPLRFDVDHIVPLADGGEHSYANTQPAHPLCNQVKGGGKTKLKSVAA